MGHISENGVFWNLHKAYLFESNFRHHSKCLEEKQDTCVYVFCLRQFNLGQEPINSASKVVGQFSQHSKDIAWNK